MSRVFQTFQSFAFGHISESLGTASQYHKNLECQEISQVQYTICEILNVDIYKKTVKRNSIYSILFPFGIYVEVLKE